MAQKCYNKACGKDFTDNHETACNFHPGAPVFHEGLKGWSCCKKRTTDFSEFLQMPGCTQGPHNPEKQEVTTEPKAKPSVPPPALRPPSPPPPEPSVKVDSPPLRLALVQAPSARKALETAKQRFAEEAARRAAEGDVIAVGTRCTNKGCTEEYSADESLNSRECMHHPGEPVFHEGMKYWSCCTRKTTDFQAFLDQKGCTAGSHKWRPDETHAAQVNCRYDFFQGADTISLSIFVKNVDPDQSWVEISPKRLDCHLALEVVKACDMTIPFYGVCIPVVDPKKCKAEILGTKVEVTLCKADGISWPQLEG